MIHPEAFRRAQQKANVASRFQMDAGVYDRALLVAYLSDPDVRRAIAHALYTYEGGGSEDVLQAIGAEVSP